MKVLRPFLGALAAAALVAGLAACTEDPGTATGGASGGPAASSGPVIQPGTPGGSNRTLTAMPTTTPQVDPDDVKFLQDMMVHHQQAIQMTELARTRAANPAVRTLSERIRVGQKPEIDAMRAMLKQWGKPAPDLAHAHHVDHSAMAGMASPAQLTALEKATGKAFDTMFLQLMIRHHQGAVTMSRTLAEKGSDMRTGEVAQDVGVTQTKEITIMRTLLTKL